MPDQCEFIRLSETTADCIKKLRVVSEDLITVDDEKNIIDLTFTPTIPHCSMATLIGLTIRVKLIRSLPSRFKVSVKITEGSHSQVNTLSVKSDALQKGIKSGLGIHLLHGGKIFDPVGD